MKQVILKNNIAVALREVQKTDAQDIVDFYNKIGGETGFLSFGKNEYPNDKQAQGKAISTLEQQANTTMVLALHDQKIIGIATLNSSQKRKSRHVGELGIGISKEFCGFGLGKMMITEILDFAKENGITKKVTLITRCDNFSAIALYEKLLFKQEGELEKESFEDGVYYDSIYMGRWIV